MGTGNNNIVAKAAGELITPGPPYNNVVTRPGEHFVKSATWPSIDNVIAVGSNDAVSPRPPCKDVLFRRGEYKTVSAHRGRGHAGQDDFTVAERNNR